MRKLWMGIISAMCAGSAMATVIYQDDFSNNSGALDGRSPNVGSAWLNAGKNFQVTNGVLQTTTNGLASAWLTMPTVSAGQVIKVSAVLVANGDVNTDYLSIGFSNLKNPTYSAGDPWLTMYRRVDVSQGKGILRVYSGLGSGGIRLVNQEALADAQGFTTNLNARNTVNYEYNTTTGNLLVWLLSANGTSVTQYNGSVNYGNVAGAIVPTDQIKYMAVSFNNVNVVGSANPAYLDNLTVEIIPEPATVGLLMVSGIGVLAIRRALR
jgi:hypothetical protein